MLLAEYNEAEKLALVRDNARQDGIFDILISLVKDGVLSVKDASIRAGVSESVFNQKMTAR